jgi:hypothetical protein
MDVLLARQHVAQQLGGLVQLVARRGYAGAGLMGDDHRQVFHPHGLAVVRFAYQGLRTGVRGHFCGEARRLDSASSAQGIGLKGQDSGHRGFLVLG